MADRETLGAFLRENPEARELLVRSCEELRGDMPSVPVNEWALVRLAPLRRLVAFVENRVLEGPDE